MPTSKVTETIFGFGHQNVQATHNVTIEFTKDADLSPSGDCILVVSTNKGLTELSDQFKSALRKPHAQLSVRIEADGISDSIRAQGSPKLTLSDPREMVLRKSEFVSDRTLGIRSDKAAKDLNRVLVEKLSDSKQRVKITLSIRR